MAGKPKRTIQIPQDSDVKGAIESNFKESFVDTLQESNTARNEMKVVIHELLRQPDTISEIKAIIDKCDRDAIKVFWKKFGFVVWSAVVFLLGSIATVIIENLISKK